MVLGGCVKKAEIPAYINLLNPEVILRGDTLREAVQDIWWFQFPNYVATTELKRNPLTGDLSTVLPLLQLNRTRYIFRGGVMQDGNPLVRVPYPFWKFDTLDAALLPDQLITFRPQFSYLDPDTTLVIAYEENFDGVQLTLAPFNNRDDNTVLLVNPTEGYRGQRCGQNNGNTPGLRCGEINFDSTRTTFAYVSNQYIPLPNDGSQVWAEIVYRGNIRVGIGVERERQGQTQVLFPAAPILPPSTTCWQTLYYNLTNIAAASPAGTRFKLFLAANSDGSARRLLIDNIRLLHLRPL